MRPETLKKGRIRGPKESGSLPGDGKAIFVEKMREKYGNGSGGNAQELELKIEQLWNGLNPAQRVLFIGKENEKEKSPVEVKKEPMPMLERRNNCKAIARVLDLKKTAKKSSPSLYSQVIKGRMKSWWKEGQIMNSRDGPPSPPHPCTSSSSSLLTVKTEPLDAEDYNAPNFEAPRGESLEKFLPTPPVTPVSSAATVPPLPKPSTAQKPKITLKIPKTEPSTKNEQSLKRKPAATQPLRLVLPPKFKKPDPKLMRVVTVVSRGPRIGYDQACQEYYRTLSQSFISDNEPLNPSLMPTYASIVQGERLIREYKFGHFL